MAKDKEEPVCTCDDEFATELCPVHDSEFISDKAPQTVYEPGLMVLTDFDLLSYVPVSWTGHPFKCQNEECNEPVLHFMKYCPSCGRRMKVESETQTRYLRELQEKMRNQNTTE